MVGIPKMLLSWMKQRSGGPQQNIFTERIVHAPGTRFLGQVSRDLVLGFSTNRRERENHDSWCVSVRKFTKEESRKLTSVGRVIGAHWL
jgi:hypothetical protein